VTPGGAAPLVAALSEAVDGLIGDGGLSGVVAGVGVDAVEVERFRQVLGRRTRLADRLFTAGELAYARAATDPVPRLSTRFAAKEATMKALGVGLGAFRFDEVEVVRVDLEAPSLVLHGSALGRARAAGVVRWHLSLTHTEGMGMALVVAEGAGAAALRSTGDAATP
jgi:holo-[acyl-carrier protein] synthase